MPCGSDLKKERPEGSVTKLGVPSCQPVYPSGSSSSPRPYQAHSGWCDSLQRGRRHENREKERILDLSLLGSAEER